MSLKFSPDRINKVKEIVDELIINLNKNGFYAYDKVLFDLKEHIQSMNEQALISALNNNALFGGAGSLWEIYIESREERKTFIKLLDELISQLKKIGVQNKRMNDVKDTLRLILKSS